MSFWTSRLVAFTVGSIALASVSNADTLAPFHSTIGGWTIDIVGTPIQSGDLIYTLSATSSAGSHRQVSLDRRNRSIQSVATSAGGGFIVIGESSVATVLTVIPADVNATTDTVLCYDPSVSPNGRFVAFRKFYPNNDEIEASIYLVYDTTLSPAANRMRSNTDPGAVEVGWAVFPTESNVWQSYDSSIFTTDTRHMLHSALTWVGATKFAFLDFSERKTRVVLVDVAGGVNASTAQQRELNEVQLVDRRRIDRTKSPAEYLFADTIAVGTASNEYVVSLRRNPSNGIVLVPTVLVQF